MIYDKPRRLQIVVIDEETGEEVAAADGVETLVMFVAPDTIQNEGYRRILLGDPESSVQLLFDVVRDVSERMDEGLSADSDDVLDDQLLMELTDGMPLQ